MPRLHYPIPDIKSKDNEITVHLELTLNINLSGDSTSISCEANGNKVTKSFDKGKELDFIIPDFSPTKELIDFGNES